MSEFYNAIRLGANNQGADKRELFLKKFAGEVMTEFETRNIMLSKTKVRTIKQGKSASFPIIGRAGAEYHTPGKELTGLDGNSSERVITIDDLLVSHRFIANIDEAMNHYDVRAPYSTAMGQKLAKEMDINILIEVINAARSTATLNDPDAFGGSQISNDHFKLNPAQPAAAQTLTDQIAALTSAIFKAAELFDTKDVPEEERYIAFRPAEYYALAQNTDLINTLYGGRGAISKGNVLEIAGLEILKSNNIPSTNTSAKQGTRAHHGVDASSTIAVAWTPDAVGTVKLMDLAMESDYLIAYQGTLMVAKYACGHGVLKPDCAIELKLDTLSN